jgi:hypothetical protein
MRNGFASAGDFVEQQGEFAAGFGAFALLADQELD